MPTLLRKADRSLVVRRGDFVNFRGNGHARSRFLVPECRGRGLESPSFQHDQALAEPLARTIAIAGDLRDASSHTFSEAAIRFPMSAAE